MWSPSFQQNTANAELQRVAAFSFLAAMTFLGRGTCKIFLCTKNAILAGRLEIIMCRSQILEAEILIGTWFPDKIHSLRTTGERASMTSGNLLVGPTHAFAPSSSTPSRIKTIFDVCKEKLTHAKGLRGLIKRFIRQKILLYLIPKLLSIIHNSRLQENYAIDTRLLPDSKGKQKDILLPKSLDIYRPKRHRTIFNKFQLNELRKEFHRNPYLIGEKRSLLAKKLHLTDIQQN
ncbi:unnamed protein product [Dracunculus medinensis]|uniref:Homeobox domain-containing protein n=1 Tax=Dracunculus medinensis TaxID=318479 RepID=A0A0N4U3Z9_DRAME|nr:unnamed protein product [Dracunculus medinensis]